MKSLAQNVAPLGLGVVLALSALAGAETKGKHMLMIQKKEFGHTADGQTVDQYTLTNKHGLQARVMTYGATWTHMLLPDRHGKLGDCLLGFDSLEPYLKGHPYFGSIAGRVANRIAKGKFTLDGKTYTLAVNNGPNHLHGGLKALDKAVWHAEAVEMPEGPAVKFDYTDPDGANGYPGNLKIEVLYTLTDTDEMHIDYKATTDKATPINLTNHAYWNLGTPAAGTVRDHIVKLDASRYTPVDETLIPTGKIVSVKGTPMDFTVPTPIGKNIDKVGKDPTGYDHNFVIDGQEGALKRAARVEDPKSGRVLEVWTDQPGIQFYTGNFLDGTLTGKGGVVYKKNQAFCLETQHFPDSINHPNFPDSVLRPGHTYKTSTVHKFRVEKDGGR